MVCSLKKYKSSVIMQFLVNMPFSLRIKASFPEGVLNSLIKQCVISVMSLLGLSGRNLPTFHGRRFCPLILSGR